MLHYACQRPGAKSILLPPRTSHMSDPVSYQLTMSILISLYLMTSVAQAVSINPNSTLSQSSNPPPPDSHRSLWNIIWSCLVTTFTCTWLSVHPNIPAPKEPWYPIVWRRIKAMFWALVAPELVIMWAMRQRKGAQRLAEAYKGETTIGFMTATMIMTRSWLDDNSWPFSADGWVHVV